MSFILRRAVKPDANGYVRKVVQGYADKGKVAEMLSDGWEIEHQTPCMFKGYPLKQMIFTLKRKVR